MNISPISDEAFFRKPRFNRAHISHDKFLDRLGSSGPSKGLVYYHALTAVKKLDPLAVEAIEIPTSVPKVLWDFFKHFGALEVDTKPNFFDIRPDLLSLDYEAKQVCFHEIEDTNPLSSFKLGRYVRIFEYADADELAVGLFIYDRYGYNQRKIDLGMLSILIAQAEWGGINNA